MSMHIEGPWLSTTSTRKRKETVTKAKQEEYERGWRDRNKRLREMGLPKESLEEYIDWLHGRVKKETSGQKYQRQTWQENALAVAKKNKPHAQVLQQTPIAETTTSATATTDKSEVANCTHGKLWVTGACTTKPSPTYTGTKMIGIGTMHKSNSVPIFSDQEAIDISTMRR